MKNLSQRPGFNPPFVTGCGIPRPRLFLVGICYEEVHHPGSRENRMFATQIYGDEIQMLLMNRAVVCFAAKRQFMYCRGFHTCRHKAVRWKGLCCWSCDGRASSAADATNKVCVGGKPWTAGYVIRHSESEPSRLSNAWISLAQWGTPESCRNDLWNIVQRHCRQTMDSGMERWATCGEHSLNHSCGLRPSMVPWCIQRRISAAPLLSLRWRKDRRRGRKRLRGGIVSVRMYHSFYFFCSGWYLWSCAFIAELHRWSVAAWFASGPMEPNSEVSYVRRVIHKEVIIWKIFLSVNMILSCLDDFLLTVLTLYSTQNRCILNYSLTWTEDISGWSFPIHTVQDKVCVCDTVEFF